MMRFGFRSMLRTRRVSDDSGVAAVEFALVLPFMLLLYFGGVEITQAVMVNRLVVLTANTVTNLVSQYTTISASTQMPDILNASTQVLSPYSSANAQVVVSCIAIDSTGRATVTWSKTMNGTALTAGQSVTVPAALDIPNTSLIFGQVSYAYTPAFDFIRIAPINTSAAVYMAPRDSTTVNMVP